MTKWEGALNSVEVDSLERDSSDQVTPWEMVLAFSARDMVAYSTYLMMSGHHENGRGVKSVSGCHSTGQSEDGSHLPLHCQTKRAE